MTTTTKFTIPPLVPSAYVEGYLAGIDAIIALLREPDDNFLHGTARNLALTSSSYALLQLAAVARALADELERRKP